MIPRAIQPEAALLVECARVRIDGRRASRIQDLVRGSVDWPRLRDLAQAHGLRPLLYHHLNAACADAIPQHVLELMRADAHLNAARNLVMTRELLALLAVFASEGIRAVSYKGPVLAETLYGSLALREFTDLDILVRPEAAVRARDLMMSRGYRPYPELAAKHDAAFRREYCEYMFTHPASGMIVEIQWDLAPRFFSVALDRDGLERRLGTGTIMGVPTSVLSPEDLLFILCVHGCKHAWSKLEWVCGVAERIRASPDLDWNLVLALAERAGALRMVRLGVALARDLLDAPLPAIAERAIARDPAVARLAAEMASDLCAGATPSHDLLPRAIVHMRMRERWRDRVRYAARLSSTPSARDWALLGSSPAYRVLAYPLRLTRLAFKYGSFGVIPSSRRPS
jgi:hypothetical protein